MALELGIPRSTAMGWLHDSPREVVTLDILSLKEQELQHEVLMLRRRIRKLHSLLRLLLTMLRLSEINLAGERVPEGKAKAALLRAADRTREFLPLRKLLRVLGLSPARYHSWRRSQQKTCSLDDRSSCPRTSPHQLTSGEIESIRKMVTSAEYRHVPTGTLAILAQRLGRVFASPSTWYTHIHRFGWRRPRLRLHPAKPKVGLRTTQPDQAWHIDTTVIRLLDGSKAFLHAVIDNFSRRILAWRLADKFDPANTIALLLEAERGTARSDEPPMVACRCRRGERQRTGRRTHPLRGAAPGSGADRAQVFKLDDRGLVARAQAPVALSELTRQHLHASASRQVLRPRAQHEAASLSIPGPNSR